MNTDKIYANKLILEYSTLTSRRSKVLKRFTIYKLTNNKNFMSVKVDCLWFCSLN